ncbi:putative hydrolase [Pseudomonas aeruginosa]|nr:putative hydrolase [Pseudomonas aeruginosa]
MPTPTRPIATPAGACNARSQVLWQERPYAAGQHPLEIWKTWAGQVEGAAIGASHMLPEDAPDAVLEHLLGFLASHREALR